MKGFAFYQDTTTIGFNEVEEYVINDKGKELIMPIHYLDKHCYRFEVEKINHEFERRIEIQNCIFGDNYTAPNLHSIFYVFSKNDIQKTNKLLNEIKNKQEETGCYYAKIYNN